MEISITKTSAKKQLSRKKYNKTLKKLGKLETANGTRQVEHLLSPKETKYLKRMAQGPTAEYAGQSLDNQETRNALSLTLRTKIQQLQGRLTPKQLEFLILLDQQKNDLRECVQVMKDVPENDATLVFQQFKEFQQLKLDSDQLKEDIKNSIYALRALEGSPRPVNK